VIAPYCLSMCGTGARMSSPAPCRRSGARCPQGGTQSSQSSPGPGPTARRHCENTPARGSRREHAGPGRRRSSDAGGRFARVPRSVQRRSSFGQHRLRPARHLPCGSHSSPSVGCEGAAASGDPGLVRLLQGPSRRVPHSEAICRSSLACTTALRMDTPARPWFGGVQIRLCHRFIRFDDRPFHALKFGVDHENVRGLPQ
jgi:hypothetical protein